MDFPQHSQQVLEQLNQQRQLGLLCDCTFVVDGIDFKAHKAVLAACSEYFRMLFVDQKDVVHLDISNAAGGTPCVGSETPGRQPHASPGFFIRLISCTFLWVQKGIAPLPPPPGRFTGVGREHTHAQRPSVAEGLPGPI